MIKQIPECAGIPATIRNNTCHPVSTADNSATASTSISFQPSPKWTMIVCGYRHWWRYSSSLQPSECLITYSTNSEEVWRWSMPLILFSNQIRVETNKNDESREHPGTKNMIFVVMAQWSRITVEISLYWGIPLSNNSLSMLERNWIDKI